MKPIFTLLFILFVSVFTFAKSQPDIQKQKKYATSVLVECASLISHENLKEVKENNLARLYMSKNSRILKELAFTTKGDRNNRA